MDIHAYTVYGYFNTKFYSYYLNFTLKYCSKVCSLIEWRTNIVRRSNVNVYVYVLLPLNSLTEDVIMVGIY